MEEVSAFVAYQNATGKNVTKQKSPTKKAQKQANNVATPTPLKKRKLIFPQSRSSAAENNNVTMQTDAPAKKKKAVQSNGPALMNGYRRIKSFQKPLTSSSSELGFSSITNGRKAFSHIIFGVELKKFWKENWEKTPLYIERNDKEHYDFLKVSTHAIDEMLQTNIIEFTKNIDVTSYEHGVRETHNPDGRAMPGVVWDFYRSGCSVRVINPQTFIAPLHKFNATLQEYFHCLVGANIYLTPPNSQGFAPHYDDIEAFVLQIEGKKEWLLYPPRSRNEELPRESSGNFEQDEIGEPCFKHVLKPGDLLYFPRGWIHQAKTVDNCHSLHITLSMYQKTSFADLFEELTKKALNNAIESNVNLRRGLPLDIWNHFGQTYSKFESNQRRETIKNVIKNMFDTLTNHLDFDDAVDKLAIKYQHDALPPVLSAAEKALTTFGTMATVETNGEIKLPELEESTKVRLLRAHIVRLTYSDGVHNLYYYSDNSKEYHGNDLNFIEVEEATVDVIKKLIHQYPNYVKIQDLSQNIEEAMGAVYSLWERGLLMTESALK